MKKILLFILAAGIANAAPTNSKQIRKKLNDTVVLEAGPLNSLTMDEVIDMLPKFSNNGLNFFYFPPKKVAQLPATNNVQGALINPATGLPPSGLPNQLNLAQFGPPSQTVRSGPKIVGLNHPIKNVTLKQLLDAMSMSFDRPMIYVVTSFGVVFMDSEEKGPRTFNRRMQISPWAYRQLKIGR